MTNTSEIYWSADGQSLETYARNISTQAGKKSVPPLRGSDVTIPYQTGETYIPKVAGARLIPLDMWVRDTGPDGEVITGGIARQKAFDANWSALVDLLWTPGRQFDLTKRFYVGDGIRIATAKAEYAGGFEPTMMGRFAARCRVNLKLADPYFYDDIEEVTNLVNGNQNVTVRGNAETQRITFDINGARNQPQINNSTLGLQLKYNAALMSSEYTQFDIRAYKSWTVDAAHPLGYTTNTRVIHSGAPWWFSLKPGVNVINLSSVTGTGAVVMKRRDAWL